MGQSFHGPLQVKPKSLTASMRRISLFSTSRTANEVSRYAAVPQAFA